MNLYEYLAILGATAWLSPIVIPWMINQFVKSQMSIISHEELEVGYTTYGPIININLAFSAEKKEALVNNIELEIKHEDQETHMLTWVWFEERLLEMETPNMGLTPFKKNQKAVALKILKENLVEKKIGFQENKFKQENKELLKNLQESYNNIKKNGQPLNGLITTRDYNELKDHFKKSFFWKAGKYTVSLKVYILHSNVPFKHNFIFQLSALDVSRLENNIKNCHDVLEKAFIAEDSSFAPIWEWANPHKL